MRSPCPSLSLLAPLDAFYARAGVEPPPAETIADRDVPPSLRAMLSAPGPLTPRLEVRHRQTLALRVLERRRQGDVYARRVVLVRRDDGAPVVMGAIEVDLARLPEAVRADVLAERVPFGHLVGGETTRPDALLRVARDPLIGDALALMVGDGWLYGRRRTLIDAGATIASIVEILAPEPG